jgi:hypothetical protein
MDDVDAESADEAIGAWFGSCSQERSTVEKDGGNARTRRTLGSLLEVALYCASCRKFGLRRVSASAEGGEEEARHLLLYALCTHEHKYL